MNYALELMHHTAEYLAQLLKANNVVVALLTLTGVVATISVQGRRLTKQFEHERGLKKLEREMLMKKEIFLSAMEALYVGIQSLTSFSDSSLSTSDVVKEYNQKSVALARLYVVALPKTIASVAASVDAIVIAQLDLSLARLQLDEILQAKATNDLMLARSEKERDFVLEMNKTDHFNGANDDQKKFRLDSSFAFHRQQIDGFITQGEAHAATAQGIKVDIVKKATEHAASIRTLLVDSVTAIRGELELPVDRDELQALSDLSLERLRVPMRKLLDSVDPRVN